MKRKKISPRAVYPIAAAILLLGIFFLWKKTNFNFISRMFEGLHKRFSAYAFYVNDTFKSIRYVSSAKTGIKILSEKNMELEAENSVLKAENEKLKRLEALKAYRDFRGSVVCYASIAGSNDDGFIYYYTIDRGLSDGIEDGDGVVTADGVAGRIVKVQQETSMVQLLTDTKSSISAKAERSRVVGILSGESYNMCSLNFVPKEEDIKEGDIIVTSGLGKSFPEGIRIGTVVQASKKVDGLSMLVKVKPFVNILAVEEVMVVKKRQN